MNIHAFTAKKSIQVAKMTCNANEMQWERSYSMITRMDANSYRVTRKNYGGMSDAKEIHVHNYVRIRVRAADYSWRQISSLLAELLQERVDVAEGVHNLSLVLRACEQIEMAWSMQ